LKNKDEELEKTKKESKKKDEEIRSFKDGMLKNFLEEKSSVQIQKVLIFPSLKKLDFNFESVSIPERFKKK